MDVPEVWYGVDLAIDLRIEVVYQRSQIDTPVSVDLETLDPPTPEERAIGRAVRTISLSSQDAWTLSVCLDCKLPLYLHPGERRERGSKRRYCRAAGREARRIPHTRG